MKRSQLVFFHARNMAGSVLALLALSLAPTLVAQDPPSNLDANEAVMHSYASESTIVGGWIAPEEQALMQAEQYTSPLVIPGAAFGADGANPESFFFPFSGGYMTGNSQSYGCMMAPAYLPGGATVTDIFVTVYDNDASFDLSASLRRVDNFVGGTVTMASANTSGQFGDVQVIGDATIVEPSVIYPDYSYYVTTCVLSGSLRIYSFRIYYDRS